MNKLLVSIGHGIKTAWGWITHWFEYGDLVPLLIVVSSVHYADVLADKDQWFVAVSIGVLVDLGHFRTIRAAFRYSVPAKRTKRKANWFIRWISRYNGQLFARWFIAAVMTCISLAYHERFYEDLWLSAPLPFLIAALAWLQRVDKNAGTKAPVVATGTAKAAPDSNGSAPVTFRYNCEAMDLHTDNQREWAQHFRGCPVHSADRERRNGKVAAPVNGGRA